MESYCSCCFVIWWVFFTQVIHGKKIKKTSFSGAHSSELRSALWKKQVVHLSSSLWLMNLVPMGSIVTYSGIAYALHRGHRDTWELEVSLLQSADQSSCHSYNARGKGFLCEFHEGTVCASLWVGLRLAMEALKPKSLLLSNTRASKAEQSWSLPSDIPVPDLCPMPQSTGSNQACTEWTWRMWAKSAVLYVWSACGDFILFH